MTQHDPVLPAVPDNDPVCIQSHQLYAHKHESDLTSCTQRSSMHLPHRLYLTTEPILPAAHDNDQHGSKIPPAACMYPTIIQLHVTTIYCGRSIAHCPSAPPHGPPQLIINFSKIMIQHGCTRSFQPSDSDPVWIRSLQLYMTAI